MSPPTNTLIDGFACQRPGPAGASAHVLPPGPWPGGPFGVTATPKTIGSPADPRGPLVSRSTLAQRIHHRPATPEQRWIVHSSTASESTSTNDRYVKVVMAPRMRSRHRVPATREPP